MWIEMGSNLVALITFNADMTLQERDLKKGENGNDGICLLEKVG